LNTSFSIFCQFDIASIGTWQTNNNRKTPAENGEKGFFTTTNDSPLNRNRKMGIAAKSE
jgi:hypothetical protein